MNYNPSWKSASGLLMLICMAAFTGVAVWVIVQNNQPMDSALKSEIVMKALASAETFAQIEKVNALAAREKIDLEQILQQLSMLLPIFFALYKFAGQRAGQREALNREAIQQQITSTSKSA